VKYGNEMRELTLGNNKKGRAREAVKNGKFSREEFMEAYKENVKIAFEAVQDLIEWMDEQLYITADHGEVLGKKHKGETRWYHGRYMPTCPELCDVPWFVVE